MIKLIRRVVPTMVVTAVAVVVTAEPPPFGASVTPVLAGSIVPAGKLEPVTLMFVTPGAPALGEATGLSVTKV
jgi:hypothetical protein